MKARIKYTGIYDNNGEKLRAIIVVQGHIIEENQLQITISVNGTPRKIRKKDIIKMHYEEELEEINYVSNI